MKKLILKTTTFILAFLVILSIITFVFQPFYFNREYALWKTKKDFIESKHKNISYNIIIGDSQAFAGFVPSLLGNNYFNLSLSGSTPIEGYFTLLKCLENNVRIDTLIISYNPMHLSYSDTFWERAMKYRFMSLDQRVQVYQKAKENEDWFWYMSPENPKEANKMRIYLVSLYFPYYYRSNLQNFSLKRYIVNKRIYQQTWENKGQNYFGKEAYNNTIPYQIPEDSIFKTSDVITEYLERMLNLATENNINVYYINVPVNPKTYENMAEEYITTYNSFFDKKRGKYPSIEFLFEIHPSDSTFFGDPTHLNRNGSFQFTHNVKSYLSSL